MSSYFQKIINSKVVAIASLLAFIIMFIPETQAASITTLSDVVTRTKVSVDSNHTITFTTPSGVEAGQNFTITFPSDFSTTSVDYTDIDIMDDATPLTLAGTPSGATWGAAFGGTGSRTLTVTSGSGTIGVSSVIVVTIGTNASGGDQAINNATTNGTKLVSIAVDNAGTANDDSGSLALAITTDDQFTVDATVDPSITFVLNDTTVNLGTVTIAAVSTDTTTFTVNTNASTGYVVKAVYDGKLRNVTNDIDDTSGNVDKNNEEFGMSTSKTSQDIATTSGNSDSQAATALATATYKSCASAGAPVSADVTTLSLHGAVSGTTPAGYYSNIVTVIATGNF